MHRFSKKQMVKNAKILWNDTLNLIKDNLERQQFDTWFASLNFSSYDMESNTLRLQVPSKYALEYIEENFLGILSKALIHYFGRNVKLAYIIKEEQQQKAVETNNPQTGIVSFDSGLDVTRTFDNFIAGLSNKLPRSVGESIAENCNQTLFNPFFVFGPSGSGKTHLINAIGMKIAETAPQKRVLYISARNFQVQFTDAHLHKTPNDFINFYQTIDVLIIDDVQEWMSAVKTQETFFHIFNHLFRNGKRIILASDRPPVDLQGMSDRLLTRLKCGLVAQLEKPDVELCKAILKAKVKAAGINVAPDIVDYIARTSGSIRDLEGILNSLIANSFVYNCNVSIEHAQKAIRNVVRTSKRELTIDEILDKVCEFYKVKVEDVAGRSRKQEIVIVRQVAMYFAAKLTDRSRSHIGRRIANRDHATVIHSCDKVLQRMKIDNSFKTEIQQLERILV